MPNIMNLYPQNDTLNLVMIPFRVDSGYSVTDSIDKVLLDAGQVGGNFIYKFGEASLHPVERNIDQASTVWVGSMLLLAFIILVIGRQLYPRKFSQSLLATTGNNHINQLLREWYPIKHPMGFLYLLSYVLLFSLFLFELIEYTSPARETYTSDFVLFLYILLTVLTLILLKFGITYILSALFKTKLITQHYLANQISFMLLGSIIFFPLLLVMVFNASETVFVITLVFISSFMVYRLVRSFYVSLSERQFALLYLFLYLCALEIVPLLLLIKTIMLIGGGSLII